MLTGIIGMFGGGGAPSVESVIKNQFAEQKKFIEAQFKQQEKVMEKLLGQTELQSVKAKALGVLDALDTRYESFANITKFPQKNTDALCSSFQNVKLIAKKWIFLHVWK